jgi:diadenosine tetraphosphate (Ap4A) HIT family hydrolase
MGMHATLRKFGYPDTLLMETEHWCVLLRPQQMTLGALVLIAKSEAGSLAALPAAAYADLQPVTGAIEQALRAFRPYAKINYVLLMMVDPHVHFHVVPRYPEPQSFEGETFADPAWPGPPDFKSQSAISQLAFKKLHSILSQTFAQVV